MLNIIIICLIGLVTGLFSGMTGFFPLGLFVVLFKYLGVGDNQTIIGTVLYLLIFPLSIGSVWQFYKSKKINFYIGHILLITIMVGSYFGSKLVLDERYKLTEKTINYVTSMITFIASIVFFINGYFL